MEDKEKDMEQWNDVKDKKSKVKTIFIIVLLVIVIGLGAFIFLNRDSLLNKKDSKAKTDEVEKSDSKEIKSEKDIEEIKDIDLSKSLNTDGVTFEFVNELGNDERFSLIVNDDKRSITVTIYEKGSKLISDTIHSTWSTEPLDKQISGFNKDIKKAYVGGMGQDAMGTTFFFIMNDGTLQYAKVFEKRNNADGTTYYGTDILDGKLTIKETPNVDGIVKLYEASVRVPQSGGYGTTLASKADGSFYDLSRIITTD